ncbi:MFS transporter [Streptomyces pactum]|uniref:MFS transporter n=2 Tax=Streptomyces pactum TaxID=68249 RepID=A0ABS0NNE3_9ACTN|nr:MFS transporter [Streptomyces pactum]
MPTRAARVAARAAAGPGTAAVRTAGASAAAATGTAGASAAGAGSGGGRGSRTVPAQGGDGGDRGARGQGTAAGDRDGAPDGRDGVSGGRDGAAGPRRGSFLAPYRRLFAAPGSLAFTLTALVARLPGSMLGVSIVLMVALTRDSYALAGAVSATGVAATAVCSPLLGRLVDRYGQSRVAVPAVLVFAAGMAAMLLCVHHDAPAWTLFVCAVSSSAVPGVGAMTRARWTELYRDDAAARHTANSFEQVVDELCFMVGPALAMVLCTTVFPEAGLLTGATLMVAGTLAFAAQRTTEPPPHPRTTAADGTAAGAGAPLRIPELRMVLVTFLATGALFGSMEVATVATVESYGSGTASSAVLALQAAGSCVAGLVFGTLPVRGSATARFVTGAAAMAVAVPPLLLAGNLPVLAVLLLLAGMATAPTMITGMSLVQRVLPPARLNEGITTVYTGLLVGISAGAAAGGWTVEHLGADAGYAAPAVAGALALAAAVGGARRTAPRAGRARG